MDPMGPVVLIIGAGISGLAAAQKLYKHGFKNLRILEATGRSGGRIRSQKYAKGLVEIGAQWIHGPSPSNPVFQLSTQYDLLSPEALSEENQLVELEGHPMFSVIYSSSGKQISTEIGENVVEMFSSWFQKSREFTKGGCNPEDSVGSFLRQEISCSYSNWDKDSLELKMALLNCLFKLECCISGTHSMDCVALGPYGEYKILPGLDCTFPRGYESLVSHIKASFPSDMVLLNKPVKTIHWKGSFHGSDSHMYPVQVECENGETFIADHVIITVPLGFLKEKATDLLSPPLPSYKLQAIQNLGFGTNNKILLEFEKPFWEPECYAIQLIWEGESPLTEPKTNLQQDWVKKIPGFVVLQPPEQLGHVLCAFIAGKESEFMESLSEDEILSTMTSLLRKCTGTPNLPPPISILRTRWHSEPYTCGSYSYVAVGSSGRDIDMLAQPLPEERECAKPLQVLFAGEATHRNFYSTTHGALLSGWREAERLIDQYPALHSVFSKSKL
ncbi:polyamine oxidase (exo-N4-amino) L homeolog [Xenopus laevis]|uniref:LOC495472 protein n=1 Tax=Xenopus laevis TaxID=8355 RepID=Q5U4L6_XENLA|nr:polyamine oxidase (exo-N4-amino) L homeolog [Xenopus laevis]AAH85046.1 LOC495472 protein [Xenopus laevis]